MTKLHEFPNWPPCCFDLPFHSVVQKKVKDIFLQHKSEHLLLCLEPFTPNSSHLKSRLLTKASSSTRSGPTFLSTSSLTVPYRAHVVPPHRSPCSWTNPKFSAFSAHLHCSSFCSAPICTWLAPAHYLDFRKNVTSSKWTSTNTSPPSSFCSILMNI